MTPDTAKSLPPYAARHRWLLWALGAAAIAVGLVLPKLAGPAGSQSGTAQASELRPEGPDLGAMLVRLVGGTVFVLGLCVVTLWLCRRWLGAAGASTKGDGRFKIIESLPIGPRCRVQLVRAGESVLLAGMDMGGLKVLLPVDAVIEDPPARAGDEAPDRRTGVDHSS